MRQSRNHCSVGCLGYVVAAFMFLAMFLAPPETALAGPLQERANPTLAGLHVHELALGIGPRPAGTEREAAAADYVAKILEDYGYVVSRTPFTRETVNGVAVSENVIGVPPTMEPNSRIILIGASLDTYELDSPGADHNASGLAAMLESARLLSGMTGRSRVAFAAFGSNEMGRTGSKAFTEGKGNGSLDPRNVAMMINIDAVGGGDSVHLIPWGGPQALPSRAFERLVEAVADSTGRSVEFDTTIAMMPQVCTDHSPFLITGVPAVTITTARSLPYYAANSFDQYWDSASEVSGANIARAADAVVAAAEWAGSAYNIGKPDQTYLAFRAFNNIISIPYSVAVIAVVVAVVMGVVCIAYANNMLYHEFARVRSAGLIQAIGMSLAMYAIITVIIWTAFLPSIVVEAVRGVERPWNAYPVPYILAGAVCAIFSATLILSLTGVRLRASLRAPVLRLSMLLQIAFVCLATAILRVGAFPFALGLIFTALALIFPDSPARKILACLAPVPPVWLIYKAAIGVGNAVFMDLLTVPIFLSLLAAAVLLPYAMTIVVLAFESRGKGGPFYASGSLYDVPPGVTLREYTVASSSARGGKRKRRSVHTAFLWILGLLTIVLTGNLFFYPSYTSGKPQPVVVMHLSDELGGHSVAFESTDNIKGLSVVSRSGMPGPAKIDARSSSYVLPYAFDAPRLELRAEMDGPILRARLSPDALVGAVRISILGPEGMAVLSSDRSYSIEEDNDMVRVSTVLSGEEPMETQFELAFPPGAHLSVEAVGSFRENPAPVMVSGYSMRFYETNRFTATTSITTR